ncbi:hypothetical protein [Bradyrhizobium sp. 191]|uniref:hypothetical protein n=1 Tax=Bradyrhizobium sp. 191 TaxID=2782659 RepID=UPI001FFE50EE|nr:hypothetical protein [Bradyrhizobium sp. 191]UPJ64585.1 hypothetical protein IVB23_32280 [Bradyrhizobium sp. 191]
MGDVDARAGRRRASGMKSIRTRNQLPPDSAPQLQPNRGIATLPMPRAMHPVYPGCRENS